MLRISEFQSYRDGGTIAMHCMMSVGWTDVPYLERNENKEIEITDNEVKVFVGSSRCGGCENALHNCTCYDNISEDAIEQINEFESKYKAPYVLPPFVREVIKVGAGFKFVVKNGANYNLPLVTLFGVTVSLLSNALNTKLQSLFTY